MTLSKGRHELACSSCGAPLHDLKRMPVAAVQKPAVSHQPASFEQIPKAQKTRKPKKSKPRKRRSWMKSLVEEAFDVIEDIFD